MLVIQGQCKHQAKCEIRVVPARYGRTDMLRRPDTPGHALAGQLGPASAFACLVDVVCTVVVQILYVRPSLRAFGKLNAFSQRNLRSDSVIRRSLMLA